MHFRELKGIPRVVIAADGDGVGLGELDGARHDSREHGLVVQRRGDGASDLLERLQFADRLSKVSRPLGDLLLEPAVGPLQLVRHTIEMIGEIGNLVLGLHLDAMAELARLQLLGADLQCANWNNHTSRQQYAGQHGQENAERQKPGGAEQQVVDRLQRLA